MYHNRWWKKLVPTVFVACRSFCQTCDFFIQTGARNIPKACRFGTIKPISDFEFLNSRFSVRERALMICGYTTVSGTLHHQIIPQTSYFRRNKVLVVERQEKTQQEHPACIHDLTSLPFWVFCSSNSSTE